MKYTESSLMSIFAFNLIDFDRKTCRRRHTCFQYIYSAFIVNGRFIVFIVHILWYRCGTQLSVYKEINH